MRLIIEADDFGLSKSITDGIVDSMWFWVVSQMPLQANLLLLAIII